MIGDLHTLDLGVTARVAGHAIVRLLRSGVLGNRVTEEGLIDGCRIVSQRLRVWYAAKQKRSVKKITKMGRISFKMLGYKSAKNTGTLKAKGAECRQFLPFVRHILTKKRAAVIPGGIPLSKAVRSLLLAYQLMRKSGHKIASGKLEKHLNNFVRHSKAAGVPLLPKFHLALHLPTLSQRAGNPRVFSEYLDESHNSFMVAAAQSAKTWLMMARILAKEQLMVNSQRTLELLAAARRA